MTLQATRRITRVTIIDMRWEMHDTGWEENVGFDFGYRAGSTIAIGDQIVRIETDDGLVGAAPGPGDERSARYLLGRDPMLREPMWHDLKRSTGGTTATPPGGIDCALWDIAGKAYGVPVYELLGGAWRMRLPCYASTFHGDDNGGLSTPADFAAFAVRCRDLGYPGFKAHGWINGPVAREVEMIAAIREAVGPEMDLMLDPAGGLRTFLDAVRLARACDEAGYLWFEDGLPVLSLSQRAHLALKGVGIRTPLLVGEHMRGLETKADAIASGAADLIRAGMWEDGGITGVMKIAALAEAHGIDVELHGGCLAHRHCMAVIRNTNYYENGLVHPLAETHQPRIYRDEQWLDLLESIDADGCLPVPTGPGLGVELDWDWIDDHTARTVVVE